MKKSNMWGIVLATTVMTHGSLSEASENLSAGPSQGGSFVLDVVMTAPTAQIRYAVDPLNGQRSVAGFLGSCNAFATISNTASSDAFIRMFPLEFQLIDEDPQYTIRMEGHFAYQEWFPAGYSRSLNLRDLGLVSRWRQAFGQEPAQQNFGLFEEYVVRSCDLSRKAFIDYRAGNALLVDVIFEDGTEVVMERMLRINVRGSVN